MDIIRLFYRSLRETSIDTKVKLSFVLALFVMDAYLLQRFGFANSFSGNHIMAYGAVCILMVVAVTYENVPGRGLLFYTMSMSLLIILPLGLFCYAAPATPAVPIDPYLKWFDNLLGYHADHFAVWSMTYPPLRVALLFAYASIFYQLYFFLVILAMLGDRDPIQRFMLTMLICYTVSSIFYLFYPSLEAGYTYHDMHLSTQQLQVIAQFDLLHRHDPLYFHNLGIIAFPSFHAIWAMAITYYTYHRKILFRIFLPLNIFVVISALATGWHYLSDVISAAILLFCAIRLSNWIFDRYPKREILDEPVWQFESARFSAIFQWVSMAVLFLSINFNSPTLLLFYTLAILGHCIMWTGFYNGSPKLLRRIKDMLTIK